MSRRRALKAAAAAAPVIATLPGGTALGNASIHGCIVGSRDDSVAMAGEADFLVKEENDDWVRGTPDYYEYTPKKGGNPDAWVEMEGRWYLISDGDNSAKDEPITTAWSKTTNVVEDSEKKLMKVIDKFTANSKTEEYVIAGTSQTHVKEKKEGGKYKTIATFNTIPEWEKPEDAELVGLAPARIPSQADGQIGLTGSCACSVDPGALSNGNGISMC
jgi:hypothetical protein